MAEVTREEFDALEARVKKLEPVIVTPPEHTPLELTLTPGPLAGQITADWRPPTTRTAETFEIRRSGTDINGNAPDWGIIEGLLVRRRVFNDLDPERLYTVRLGAIYVGGTVENVSADAKPLKGPLEPPPGPVTGGFVRVSDQPYSHLCFSGGDMPISAVKANDAEVKTVFDGAMTFIDRRNWGTMKSSGIGAAAKSVLDAGRMYVLRMPFAPSADGMNTVGARNGYRDEQLKWAEWAISQGMNNDRTWLSLCWEWNAYWYKWGAQYGGNSALKEAMRNFIDNVRSVGLTKVKFENCVNVKNEAPFATWKDVWLGNGYFSAIGIDQYDSWPATFNAATWEGKMREPLSIRSGIKIAKELGVKFNLDECGNWHESHGGKDNPFYWDMVFAELGAAKADIGWLTGYNDEGAPRNLLHDWAHNPRALERYRVLLAKQRVL